MRVLPALGIVFALALAIRLAHALDLRDTVLFESPLVDALVYDEAAREIARNGPSALELPYYQPPLYPMLLGAVYALTNGSYLAPRILQALLGAATVGLVFLIAFRERGLRAASLGALLLTLYGPVLWLEGELLPTTLVLFLNTAAVALLLGADHAPRPLLRLAAAGLLLGLSSAARPTTLLLAAGAVAWWMAGGGPARTTPSSRRVVSALLLGAITFLPLLPFTLANRIGAGENMLVSYNGGINFYLGNGAGSDSLTAIQPGYAWDRLQVEPHRAGVRSRAEESSYWVRRALAEAADDPAAWASAFARKVVRLLDVRETPRNLDWEVWRHETALLSLPLVGFGIGAPLALLGFGCGGLSGRVRSLLGVVLLQVAAQNLLFFVTGRYRVEAAPVLCLLGGAGLHGLLATWRARSTRIWLVAAAALAAIVWTDFLGERSVDRARAAMSHGYALRRAGFPASAERKFEEALRARPGDPDAHRLLGELALERKEWARAITHYDAAVARAPDYLMALLGKAQALESAGARDEAETVYRRALEVDPWSYEVRLNYGVFLGMAGRTAEARRMFEEGMRLAPEKERFLANLENLRRIEAARREDADR